jgi:GAF domain-containing protein
MAQTSNQLSLLGEFEALLAQAVPTDAGLQSVLDFVLNRFGCTSGTIHSLNSQSQILHLRARRNIPDGLLPRIEQIPVGKGMAGLAVERCRPVQVCNLQTDTSGVAKPAAKETGMKGSIALPIMEDNQIVGVLGVAKASEYDFKEEEIATLMELGRAIGRLFTL